MTARWSPPPQPGPPLTITPRMADVLTCLCRGMTTRQIARRLYVTENTVRTHVRRLLRAAGVNNRTQLVAAAVVRPVVVEGGRAA